MARDLFRFQAWIVVAVFIATGPLLCQAGENPELQGLVDELRTLADKSRNERAADRWLQQALEDLVSKLRWPCSRKKPAIMGTYWPSVQVNKG